MPVCMPDELPNIPSERIELLLADVRAEIRLQHEERRSFFELQARVDPPPISQERPRLAA